MKFSVNQAVTVLSQSPVVALNLEAPEALTPDKVKEFIEYAITLDVKSCCLCGEDIVDDLHGHNPSPVECDEDGVCCSKCNNNTVIPARIKQLSKQ